MWMALWSIGMQLRSNYCSAKKYFFELNLSMSSSCSVVRSVPMDITMSLREIRGIWSSELCRRETRLILKQAISEHIAIESSASNGTHTTPTCSSVEDGTRQYTFGISGLRQQSERYSVSTWAVTPSTSTPINKSFWATTLMRCPWEYMTWKRQRPGY